MRWTAPAALLLLPALAGAQTLTIDESKFRRANDDNDPNDPDLNAGDPRRVDQSGDFGGINLDECTRQETWHYAVTVGGYSGKTLFVYTGDSCSDQANRDGTGVDCKILHDITGHEARTVLGSDSSRVLTYDFPANEIANVDGSSCENLDDNVTVWFLVMESESDATPLKSASTPSTGDIRVLTILPDAPSDVGTSPGDGRSDVSWNGAVDNEHFYVVCSPSSGGNETPSSTTPQVDDAGQEICAGDAPTEGFAAGATFDRSWRCDNSDKFAQGVTVESATVEDLVNGVQYHFAAVAVDDVGNPSVLSEVACGTPKPVEDFFELYRREGGKGGGGLCSAGPGGPSTSAWGLGALVLGASILRRRRSS
jgi:MYXO-CTERM domain-containing protein